MERPKFFSQAGNNLFDKILQFSKQNYGNKYFIAILCGFTITIIARLLFIVGFIDLLTSKNISKFIISFFIIYFCYFLVLTGPLVSGARYRLPIESIFIIFSSIGIKKLIRGKLQ